MKKICFLASGNGGTLKFLHFAIKNNQLLKEKFQLVHVIADRDCGALNFANSENIKSNRIKYNRSNSAELYQLLNKINPDYIITNIHKILDEEIVKCYENRLINLHYSILPAYKGLIGMDTVEQGLSNNNNFFGATCHLVDKEVDNGVILSQCSIPYDYELGSNELKDLVFKGACLILLNSLLILNSSPTNKATKEIDFQGTKLTFSPALIFDIDKFRNTAFWNLIK